MAVGNLYHHVFLCALNMVHLCSAVRNGETRHYDGGSYGGRRVNCRGGASQAKPWFPGGETRC